MNAPLGQLFVVGFDGFELPNDAQRLLADYHVGGAILFKRNIDSLEQVIRLNTQIINASTTGALISVDQEGGRVARLRDICTPIAPMRELGLLRERNPEIIYKVASMMGRELAALGFHLDFAPVADVDSNPDNPVIGDRSFSSDPHKVADLCAEFIKGLQQSGIAACAKHFPGHGDTHQDSHLELPVLFHKLQRLRDCELLPFQKAIAANVATIMTAHVLLPEIDDVPATLSARILSELLRRQMRFEGLIISDDLEMKGIADHYSLREILYKGLNAGVDVFLICSDTQKAEAAIVETQRLIDSGEVPPEVVQRSLERVMAFKQKYVGAIATPSLEYAQTIIRSKPHMQLMQA